MDNEWTQEEIQESYNKRKDRETELLDEWETIQNRALDNELEAYPNSGGYPFYDPMIVGIYRDKQAKKRVEEIQGELAYLLDNLGLIERYGKAVEVVLRCMFPKMRADTKISDVPNNNWRVPMPQPEPHVYYKSEPEITPSDYQVYNVELKVCVIENHRLYIDFCEGLNTLFIRDR